jgi:hypothetical protein
MPFAGYANFAACVKANSSKSDPQAYCATVMRATEKKEGAALPNISTVTDVIDVGEAEFNKDETTGKMTAKVTIIKAGRAKNPRNYRSSAIQRAAKEGIYNGARMFVDHSDKPPLKRSMKELVAAVESTEYNAKNDSVDGTIEFFNPEFYDYAQRARKHTGISASHRIKVQRVRESSGQMIEDVEQIVGVHSVDWVVYPSAGGEVISFARESEGVEDVEWTDITADTLKANAPELYAQLTAKESKDDPDDDGDGDEQTPPTQEAIMKMVQEAIAEDRRQQATTAEKKEAASKKTREYLSKSGLPPRTQSRIQSSFSNALEFVETEVAEAVEDAKAELKEAGAGPHISGQGPSGSSGPEKRVHTARESVDAAFGIEKVPATSGKES